MIEHRAQILASIAVTAIVVGGLLHAFGSGAAGDAVWAGAVALLAAELAFEVGRSMLVEPAWASTRSRWSQWSARSRSGSRSPEQ